jgi:hypothetical protein
MGSEVDRWIGRVEVCDGEADSSLTTPEPAPKSLSLFGAPGTFGDPFVQNDIGLHRGGGV